MSFGFGSGFGQQQQPFGSTLQPFGQPAAPFGQGFGASTPAFGASTPAFGASTPAFGAPASTPAFGAPASTPAFGVASTPAFGASAAAPAFGAASTPFGGSTFGAKPAGFGFGSSTPASPFGSSMPAFGAASTPAFGASPSSAPAFGAPSPFGASFGAASTPAFGAASTPAFGATATTAFGAASAPAAFGTTSFGASPSPFGGGGSGQGTRAVPYQKHQEQDQNTSGAKTTVFFMSITAMPAYQAKSVEELRSEDYQAGATSASAAGGAVAGFGGQQSSSPFGTTTPASPFGGVGASAPAFGAASTPAFGATTFGQQSQAGFSFGSTPAFGASPAPPAFGSVQNPGSPFGGTPQSSNPFGSSTSPFGGGGFGAQQSAPAFGAQQSAPAFGAASTPAFNFNQATPPFGAASTPAFGSATPNLFGAASTPGFGAASTPAFGQSSAAGFSFSSSTPAFGAQSAASPFGGTPQGFGATMPAFGGGLFNSAPRPASFGATQSTMFGASSMPAFNFSNTAGATLGGGMFGAASAPSFNTGAPLFGGGGMNQMPFSPGGMGGQPAQQYGGAQPPMMLPGIATSPYGVLPEQPKMIADVAQYKVGLSSRPVGKALSASARPTTLLTPRSITPTSGLSIRARRSCAASRQLPRSPADFLSSPLADTSKQSRLNGSMFVARDNPTRLFIRDPLPTTDAATISSLASPSQRPHSWHHSPDAPPHGGGNLRAGVSGREDDGWGDGRTGDDVVEATPQTQYNGTMSNKKVSALLPVLHNSEYYCEPSLRQLSAMAREDPPSLEHVHNFTVGRKGYGAVRFIEPVDVRGLRLDEIVVFERGAVEVYADDPDKPDIGDGLNKPAVISLHKVFKIDKATNKPTTDQNAIEKFRSRLKAASAKQNSKFISYSAADGTWVFEVEHFSRYGLSGDGDDDSDDDDDGVDEDGIELSVGDGLEDVDDMGEADDDASRRSKGTSERFGMMMEEGDSEWEEAGDEQTEEVSDGEGALLQVALPVHLNISPAALQGAKEGLYASTGALTWPALGAADAPPRPPVSRGRKWTKDSTATAATPIRGVDGDAPDFVSAGSTAVVPLPLPLQPTTPISNNRLSGDLIGRSGSIVDAGIMLGQSVRVGWAGGGRLAVAGATCRGSVPGVSIAIQQLQVNAVQEDGGHVEGTVGSGPMMLTMPGKEMARKVAAADGLAGVWEQALEVHMQFSSVVGGDGDDRKTSAPQLALRCSTQQELQDIADKYMESTTHFLQQHGSGLSAVSKVCLQHSAHTWHLLRVLFAHRVRQQPTGVQAAAQEARDTDDIMLDDDGTAVAASDGVQEVGDDDDGVGDEVDSCARLTEMTAKAGLSSWLMDRARPLIEAQLANSTSGGHLRVMLQLLSGFQLPAAACVSAAAGDVRLSTLIAQGPRSLELLHTIQRQLGVWQSAGMKDFIDPARLLVYYVMSGDVAPVIKDLCVDWKRAFGMHLWYKQAALSSVKDALESYTDAAVKGDAPSPVPLYAERLGVYCPPGVYDMQYHLMGLACDSPTSQLMSCVLQPQGHTPHVLDCLQSWLVWCVLSAIGVVDPNDARFGPQVTSLHLHLITQLSMVPSLSHWCIYVALHLPPVNQQGARSRLVKELLIRTCPDWVANNHTLAFLRDKLAIPPQWLAAAQAVWYKYENNSLGELSSLLSCGSVGEAVDVIAHTLAPPLILACDYNTLTALMQRVASVDTPATHGVHQLMEAYKLYIKLKDTADGAGDQNISSSDWLQHCYELKHLLGELAGVYGGGKYSGTSWHGQVGVMLTVMAADVSRLLTASFINEDSPDELFAQALAVCPGPIGQRERLTYLHTSLPLTAAALVQ